MIRLGTPQNNEIETQDQDEMVVGPLHQKPKGIRVSA